MIMKLNALFSDGAVFQRRIAVPVFGTTDPESIVEVSFNGRTYTGLAGYDGNFLIRIAPQEAGGPYSMEVRNTRTGATAVVNDILIGEVWVASGQSNMEYPINVSVQQMQEFIAETAHDTNTIRMFTVPRRASAVPEREVAPQALPADYEHPEIKPGQWICAWEPEWSTITPENIRTMSAVALWFAKKLRDDLKVPVGILSSSWGGTIVEAWTSMEGLRNDPEQAALVQQYMENLSDPDRWAMMNREMPMYNANNVEQEVLIKKYCTPCPEDAGTPQGWGKLDFDDSNWKKFSIPGSWMVEKLSGNGVVWIRKKVELPVHWAGKDLEVHLGGVDKHDTTFFNGEKIGSTGKGFELDHWNEHRCYPVPGELVKAGVNVIAVRAYSFIYDGAFTGSNEDYYVALAGTDEKIAINGACVLKTEVDWNVVGFPCNVDMGPHNPNSFGILFDSMIRPLLPYGIRGAIWYQGCSNTHTAARAKLYAHQMETMIRDWRYHWQQGAFPFIQVSLAGYTQEKDYAADNNWCYLRDSQRRAMRATPNSGIASALDVGDAKDIHPADKKTVGTRLALWALENTYGQPIFGTAPEVRSVSSEAPGVLRLTFDNCAEGLAAKDGVLKGFYMAGPDGEYVPAEAVLEGNTVIVKNSAVPTACSVRYAWSENPMAVVSLYNSAGLPATPFEIGLN